MDYVDRTLRYAAGVTSGEIIACKWVKLACQRHLDDLQREGWKYRFDAARANRVCRYVELLPHIKGDWARPVNVDGVMVYPTINLEDWQCFIICVVFGWIDQRGKRRFKRVYVEVPRKNAKSTMSSGIALYMLTADGEPGAEVYSAATTGEQARIVFDDAKRMALRSPALLERFGVGVATYDITIAETASTFRALNAEGSTLDGLNIHCAIVDELHAHKRRELYDVLDSGTGSRSQPLLWMITTAGSDRSGICYEQRAHVIKVLERVFEDESFFGIIYTIDDEDDWADPAVWAKANPNYGVSVLPDDMEAACRKAMSMPSAVNGFLTKRLNVWVNADSAWMDMRAWDACGDPVLTLEQFEGAECLIAHDLASKVDIADKVRLFWRDIEGRRHYYAFAQHYLNEQAIEDGRNSQYSGWARRGLITVTPGNVTDFGVIEDDLLIDAARFRVQEAPYDPFQATQFSQRMVAANLPMVEVGQTVKNFSEPMKWLEALVLEGRFHHDGDPVLTWMVSNVVCHRDAKDNIFPRKEREENKIDGVVALLMCLNRAIADQAQTIPDGV
ncbi:terminase large subunit [Noviherbaspirillum cavernae]|uniref:Terminase large subunit n=1 Tax=Noviherbaspirillum cavernae TaxID=2320862 RepID=A0A418X1D8_9BURK|nr:terminase TerL endonuclease subunit [Noviherbaspirillum cavernae]RJG06258.1 terminase large subunit [Noviherbaspirillum cavernae]